MAEAGTTSAAVLALVLAAAAVAKVRAPGDTARTFERLGLSRARLLSATVPVAEAGAALLLVVRPWVGAAVSLALLAGFTAVILRSITLGLDAPCGCFGAIATEPLSGVDVLRNALLAALAVPALAVPAGPVRPTIGVVVAVVAAVLAGAAVLRVVRSRQRASD